MAESVTYDAWRLLVVLRFFDGDWVICPAIYQPHLDELRALRQVNWAPVLESETPGHGGKLWARALRHLNLTEHDYYRLRRQRSNREVMRQTGLTLKQVKAARKLIMKRTPKDVDTAE